MKMQIHWIRSCLLLSLSLLLIGTPKNLVLSAETDDPPIVESSLSLQEVLQELHGGDYLHPTPNSRIGKYLAETGAQTLIRRFWRAPEYNRFPPHELGPERLVVAVSAATFPIFLKYFSSKHFLLSLGGHGNSVVFEGRRSQTGESGYAWMRHVLVSQLSYPGLVHEGPASIPIVLSSSEADRARVYFKLSKLEADLNPGLTVERSQYRGYSRLPFNLPAQSGRGFYSGSGAFSYGCSSWLPNLPIGDNLVSEYWFSMGDVTGANANHQTLVPYRNPWIGVNEQARVLTEKLWTVPGHQQLGEMIDSGANRRGEFDNAGWTTYTLSGSASIERVPVVFYSVGDVTRPIDPNFNIIQDGLQ